MRPWVFLVVLALFSTSSWAESDEDPHHRSNVRPRAKSSRSEDADFWRQSGQQLILDELNKVRYNSVAKNIIFFLGDGMSVPTVTAARIYKGQQLGNPGEEAALTFDTFPYAALSRTYCVDAQVADSACSATAYLCGVKNNIDTIGVDANVLLEDCQAMNNPEYQVDSIMDWAQAAGKGTGIVTTTRVTHATPAGAYAHTAQRDWMADSDMPANINTTECSDIAEQLIENAPGNQFKVILGGGRTYFLPNTVNDTESGRGRRLDGKDLIAQWKADDPRRAYVTSQEELLALNLTETDAILGLFSPSDMEYFIESSDAKNPTLEEMTRSAIQLLQKESNGYVLLVEGGRIDHAHHATRAKASLEETLQFDLAVGAALELSSREDTLIVVTADHSHTMSVNGYPDRGADILGFIGGLASDRKPQTILSYANGPGFADHLDMTEGNGRRNLTGVDTTNNNFRQPATVPLGSETHGGDDVAIYAIGPQAHMFQGVYEQHYIAHAMAYAACIGPGHCFKEETSTTPIADGSNSLTFSTRLLFVCIVLVLRAFPSGL